MLVPSLDLHGKAFKVRLIFSSCPFFIPLFRFDIATEALYVSRFKKMEEYAGKQGNEEILSYLVDVNKQECLFTFLFHLWYSRGCKP